MSENNSIQELREKQRNFEEKHPLSTQKIRKEGQSRNQKAEHLYREFRKYLNSIGIRRVSDDQVRDIIRAAYAFPYEYLANKNKKIEYQGAGVHLLGEKWDNQVLQIYGIGKWELKAINPRRSKVGKRAVVKYTPPQTFTDYLVEKVKVAEDGEE